MFSSVPLLSALIRLACSSDMYSSSVCSLKLSLHGQEHHASSWNIHVLHVGCDWGHISIVVWQAADHFRACLYLEPPTIAGLRSTPSPVKEGAGGGR